MTEFEKYATRHCGISSTTYAKYTSAINKNAMAGMVSDSLTPYIIEERQLNMTQMDVFSRLMMDRIIFLGTAIDDYTSNVIQAQLLFLESVDNQKDIQIYLNSPGGGVYAGLGIYDTMQYIQPKVATICTGLAASMASVLLCAGEKSGLFIGHTEAIVTGTLAGANAARLGAGKPLLTLPETLAVGDIISAANASIKERHDTLERFTFSGGNYFKRMQEKNMYTTDLATVAERVDKAGLTGVYNAGVL